MLSRFRARCDVKWEPAPAAGWGAPLAVVLAVVLVLTAAAPPSAPAAPSVAARGLTYLERVQNRDGGWGAAPGQASSPTYTGWVLIGQAAAARGGRCDAAGVRYLQRGASRVRAAGDVQRTILALRACGRSAGSLGSRLNALRRADGSVAGLVNQTAFGIFAWRALGVRAHDGRLRRAANFLARNQNADGGFSFSGRGGISYVDDTAAAIQGLVDAGRSRSRGPVARAVRFLRARQNRDGGFGATGGASNAQSTAWAIQALVAVRIDPERLRRRGSRSPAAYLRSLAGGDGSIRYSRTSAQTPVWVTGQALLALARRSF
jgi:prenyltransferase beta subunit